MGIDQSIATLVWDAATLIDLYHADLLSEALSLPYEMIASDFAIEEVLEVDAGALAAMGLRAFSLTGEEVLALEVVCADSRSLSVSDLASLHIAGELSATLVTGDASLRDAAVTAGTDVHGVLWVLDLLVACGSVPASRCAEGLRAMRGNGARLPDDDCEKRLRQWDPCVARSAVSFKQGGKEGGE